MQKVQTWSCRCRTTLELHNSEEKANQKYLQFSYERVQEQSYFIRNSKPAIHLWENTRTKLFHKGSPHLQFTYDRVQEKYSYEKYEFIS